MLLQILSIASGALGLLLLILNMVHSSKLSGLQAALAEVKSLIDDLDQSKSPPQA